MLQTRREKEIDRLISSLYEEKEQIKTRKMWSCTECGGRTVYTKLIIVEQMWYEEPFSCNGGDTWHTGDDYYVWCNKCNTWVRSYKEFQTYDWDRTKTDEQKKILEASHPDNKSYWQIREAKYRCAEYYKNYNRSGSNFDLEKLREEERKREERRFDLF